MNDNVFVVFVDTRAMYPSDIDGYEEHTCTREAFDAHVLLKPRVKCIKSKVAELCGLDMKVYFHDYMRNHPRALQDSPELAMTSEKEDLYPRNMVNGAATLLTFDPRTGFPEYNILGEAFVVMDSGDYQLSSHQVWGIQDLISEARDLYYCDPEHSQRGQRQLLRWCLAYREQEWGPLTIYEPRVEFGTQSPDEKLVPFKDLEDSIKAQQHIKEMHEYYNHRHFPDCQCPRCNQSPHIRDHEGENPAVNSRKKEKSPKHRRWEVCPMGNAMCNFE
jgi:hypothetical protein